MKTLFNKKLRLIYLLALAIILTSFSCKKLPVNPETGRTIKTFKIKKGTHSSGLFFDCSNSRGVDFIFSVNDSWIFPAPEKNGWSKIFGIAKKKVHKNSMRLVFQNTSTGHLIVGAYCYVNGVSPQDNPEQKIILDTIQPGFTYNCRIIAFHNFWKVVFMNPVNDKVTNFTYIFDSSLPDKSVILKPYIGGTYTLENDFYTTIEYKFIN